MFIGLFVFCLYVVFNKLQKKCNTGEKVLASIFPLTFICGIVGLGVAIATSLLIVKIIAVVLLVL